MTGICRETVGFFFFPFVSVFLIVSFPLSLCFPIFYFPSSLCFSMLYSCLKREFYEFISETKLIDVFRNPCFS